MQHTLRELRRLRGWSQIEVAERARICPKRYSKFETGERRPRLDELEAICRALEVSVDCVLIGDCRPRGRPAKPEGAGIGAFRVANPAPRLPLPADTCAGKVNTCRRLYPDYMRDLGPMSDANQAFLEESPSESPLENLLQYACLREGGRPDYATLPELGWDRWPAVHWKTGRCEHHYVRPVLVTPDYLITFQVGVQTRWQRHRMDGLAVVLKPQRVFIDVEADEEGHNEARDAKREEELGLVTIRFTERELLAGATVGEKIRALGYGRGRRR